MKLTIALLRAAGLDAWAKRRALFSEAAIMLANDVAWLAFWLLLLNGAGPLRGWTADRVMVLLAIAMTGAGLGLAICSNVRRLGRLIADGELVSCVVS